jgi:hypothetical protein
MTYQQFHLLMIFWKVGLADTFNVLKLCVNCGSQYVGIVLASAVENFYEISRRVLLEPVFKLGMGYQFIKQLSLLLVLINNFTSRINCQRNCQRITNA